ncbi:MAG: helix-turn-helix transcriptional regulator [Puia sp.]|nr:helix-turn-helix transcriptional regulator [Puia sp.]
MIRPGDQIIITEFGARLKNFRKARKLSLRGFAAIADMDFAQIDKMEKGETNPTLTTLLRLAEALQADPNELIRGLSALK